MSRLPAGTEHQLVKDDLLRMNVPEEFWRVKVTNLPKTSQAAVKNYVENIDQMFDNGAGLFITGSEGSGKTSAGVIILKRSRERGYTSFFISVSDLRESIRSKLSFEDSKSVYDRCREVDWLLLDDICTSDKEAGWFGEQEVADLVTARGQRHKLTILTSRIPFHDLGTKLPLLARSLLGYLTPIDIQGENLRKARAALLKDLVQGK